MQTREPRKRVNGIFVFILIITIPLIIFTVFMMNTIPTDRQDTSRYEQEQQGAIPTDSLMPDTSSEAWRDSTLENN
ncbi:MAG: hypothetical protein R6W90_19070 [Ignavibacteriaceae bacterium]